MVLQSMTPRRGRMLLLVFDDGSERLLDRQTVEESPCRVGSVLDEEALEALAAASERRRAREYALYLLGLRDYGEGELRRKLREKGYGGAAEETVAQMQALGLLDDAVYARRLARDCRLRRLYARRRTVQELCARGVARETAEEAVDAVDEADDLTDAGQALALLRKKRCTPCADRQTRQRAFQMLARYGYGGDASREAWRALADEDTTGGDEEEYGD